MPLVTISTAFPQLSKCGLSYSNPSNLTSQFQISTVTISPYHSKPKMTNSAFISALPVSAHPLRTNNNICTRPTRPYVSAPTTLQPIEAMRHRKKVPKLNKPADQRKALLRSLTTELIRHGRIRTTHARAKAVRKTADHMITLAKDGSLHSRRQALGYMYDKQLVHALFEQVPERYAEQNGGYTRVLRTVNRKGDNAPMGIIELV